MESSVQVSGAMSWPVYAEMCAQVFDVVATIKVTARLMAGRLRDGTANAHEFEGIVDGRWR